MKKYNTPICTTLILSASDVITTSPVKFGSIYEMVETADNVTPAELMMGEFGE